MNHQEIDYEWLLEETVKEIEKEKEFNIYTIIRSILSQINIDIDSDELNAAINILSTFNEKIKKMALGNGFIYAPYIPLMTSEDFDISKYPSMIKRYGKKLKYR